MGPCGIAAGAQVIFDELDVLIKNFNNIKIDYTSCNGFCHLEPLIETTINGKTLIFANLLPEKLLFLLENINKRTILSKEIMVIEKETKLKGQNRIVLENCGIINPDRINDYLEKEGYEALKNILLNNKTAEQIIDIVKRSGLRGRGGAGFSTGTKWEFARKSLDEQKYVICNADEGDPGAFMDRAVMEGDPHRVLEGLIISGYAIGANTGYIYCRAEYPLAIKRLKQAIADAEIANFLGDNILDSAFSFKVIIKEGAGAFVCGEETALIASIEGQRGLPRIKPPFPATKGLWGKPTNINNVETLANIPWIIRKGAESFNSLGTEKSKGTKVFSLAGKINNAGLIEVEMGISLRKILYEIGGGSSTTKSIKAVQLGGPSGGCIPVELFDTVVDYESLMSTGAIVGSGGMVVVDEDNCMVDLAKYFLQFIQSESCGKCTFCRIGTKRMLEILTRMTDGKASLEDLSKLKRLAQNIGVASLCALGKTAPNPVMTTLRYFEKEYLEHINKKKCSTGSCKALMIYIIDEEKCIGCTKCAKNCPVNTISGILKKPHFINQEKCIKCGKCEEVCPVEAISKS
ncbi:MAG: NADH-quinone oxidoreductase subunit NuoF [Candidatus Riflemargulisbacteria bacterium]